LRTSRISAGFLVVSCVCCGFGCCKLFSAFLYHQPFGLY
jgi:hypothetical protein